MDPRGGRRLLVRDVEVVTVTDHSAAITWFTGSTVDTDRYGQPMPVPADTELLLGVPGRRETLATVLHDDAPTAYHHAEVDGLEPGRAYAFEARSAGLPAAQTALQLPGTGGSLDPPGAFRTLDAPAGRHLFTVALANDLHVGETVSGLIAGDFPPGFTQDPGQPPYPETMLAAMLDDLRRPDRRADVLLVAGDLTAEAAPADAARARQLLDGFGRLGRDYFVVRGNHDRPRAGADAWGDVFSRPRQRLFSVVLGGLRLVGLDTTTPDEPSGELDVDQLDELAALLAAEPERPTLVFGHHPVTYESAVTAAGGPGFVLDRASAGRLEALYSAAPGVFLHHAGHTHRNKRTFLPDRAELEFLEVAAAKEYPGGYSLLRLYTDGYSINFYKTRTNAALAWSQRTRGQYFGLYPAYTLGTVADRNHRVRRDLSGLTGLTVRLRAHSAPRRNGHVPAEATEGPSACDAHSPFGSPC